MSDIRTRPASKEYRKNFDRIFGAKSPNQCDGCRRGLPIRKGGHYNPDGSYDHIGCTAHLYGAKPGEVS